MKRNGAVVTGLAAAALLVTLDVSAKVRVQYGRITNVQTTTVSNSSAAAAGTLVGGAIGIASGSGQSGSNRALRGVGGAAAGRAVGNMAGSSQAFEYTVLIDGTQTVRLVSDQAGKRVGDCVAVEQGQFANIRLVADSNCAARSQPAAAKSASHPTPAPTTEEATACEQAKAQVLAAKTDDELDVAERRMRLLCGE